MASELRYLLSAKWKRTGTADINPGGVIVGVPTLVGISCAPPTNPPITESYVYTGTHNYGAQSGKQALFNYFDNELKTLASLTGPVMTLFHSYDGTVPTDISNSGAAWTVAQNLSAVINSKANDGTVSNGTHNAAIDSLVASLDAIIATHPTRKYWLILNHEPENDNGGAGRNQALYRGDIAAWCKRVLDKRISANIIPGFCLMSFTFDQGNEAGWNPYAELVTAGVNIDNVVAGPDGYSAKPATKSAAQTFGNSLPKLQQWGFTRFGISEVGVKSSASSGTGVASRAWMGSSAGAAAEAGSLRRLADSYNMDYIGYFFSGVGQNAAPDGWFMQDDTLKINYANFCRLGS